MAQEIADSTLLDTWASGGNIVEPDSAKIIEGWQLGEQPPHEYMNWLQNTFGSKLNHILKNGVASWNNETEYLAGSSVQYNGNVWLCKATNTNSAPTDANANWKRVITIEALENLLVGYVATTGNQTIAGVKTFSSSPIVPTLTAGDNSTKVASTAFVNSEVGVTNSPLVKTALNASGNAPIYACRAWVTFNAYATFAIRASGNVSSVTDNGVGDYTVNFTTAMPDVNYNVIASGARNTSGEEGNITLIDTAITTPTESLVGIINGIPGTVGDSTLAKRDNDYINVSIFR